MYPLEKAGRAVTARPAAAFAEAMLAFSAQGRSGPKRKAARLEGQGRSRSKHEDAPSKAKRRPRPRRADASVRDTGAPGAEHRDAPV